MKRDKKISKKNKEDDSHDEEESSDDSSSESDSYVPKNTNYKCLKCKKYCASSSSLKRHEQTVHTEEKDKLRNEKRLKSKPKPKPFKCDVCKKVGSVKYSIRLRPRSDFKFYLTAIRNVIPQKSSSCYSRRGSCSNNCMPPMPRTIYGIWRVPETQSGAR